MKVEVFRNGKHLITKNFRNWADFEEYMLRKLTLSMSINIRFQGLEEMIQYYEDILELVECAQLAQDQYVSHQSGRWEVEIIHPFGEVLNSKNLIQATVREPVAERSRG